MANSRRKANDTDGSTRQRKREQRGEAANWMLVDAEQLRYAITAVAASGGALRIGYTRDGGAYAIGVYGDGEPYTEYLRPSEDVSEYLEQLSKDFGGIVGDGSLGRTVAK